MKKIFLVLCGIALLQGCGDDGVTAPPSTTTLTQAQAEELASLIDLDFSDIPETGNAKLSTRLLESSFGPTTTPCGVSGEKSISGSVNSTGNDTAGSLSFSSTRTLTACTENLESGGQMTGNGSVTFSGSASGDENSATFNATIVGSIDVTGSAEANITPGTCGIGINMNVTANQNSGSYSITGTICGVAVNFNGSGTGTLN